MGGPQGRSGWVLKISHPPGFDPWTVQPVASRYTNWAIPALVLFQQANKIRNEDEYSRYGTILLSCNVNVFSPVWHFHVVAAGSWFETTQQARGNVQITQQCGMFQQPLLQRKSNKYYIFPVCVCSFRIQACNVHLPCYIFVCCLSGSTVFFHVIVNGTIFRKSVKATSHMPCCAHAMLIHTCHAVPLPFSYTAMSFESSHGSWKYPNC
jgi:hypothetical protein